MYVLSHPCSVMDFIWLYEPSVQVVVAPRNMKNIKAEPRYVWLRSLLERDIRDGKYKVGTMLPKEDQLAITYDVSRHTVREAMRGLVAAGMIERFPSKGTVVTAQQPVMPAQKFAAGVSSMHDVLQYTEQTRLSILLRTKEMASATLAKEVGADKNMLWVKFLASRWLAESALPIGFACIYVRPEFEGVGAAVEQDGGSIFALLDTMYGVRVTRVWQKIEATMMPESAPFAFRNDIGAPALRMMRVYYSGDGTMLSFSDNHFLSDRFQLISEWER
jgi:GntR family transcriptional regulator